MNGFGAKIFLISLLIPISFCIKAQERILVYGEIVGDDTIPTVYLKTVYVFSKKIFKNKRAERRYSRLKRNVMKVYPYALKANKILRETDFQLVEMQTNKERRHYINDLESDLKEQFTDELKNLTITQGKILVKLLDRETGYTCHYLIKELKGSFIAFFWQNIGRLFGYNLKTEYDSQTERDIETIVLSIENFYN